jgi:hypothetical protein
MPAPAENVVDWGVSEPTVPFAGSGILEDWGESGIINDFYAKHGTPRIIARNIVWLILFICIASMIIGPLYFAKTSVGLALVLGSGIVFYECILIMRRLSRKAALSSQFGN